MRQRYRTSHRLLVVLIAALLVVTSGCGGKEEQVLDSPSASQSTAEVRATNTPENDPLLSIVIDSVRLSQWAESESIMIETVMLAPFDANNESMQFRGEYTNSQPFDLLPNSTYRPESEWRIAVPRSALDNEDFSLWFVVAGPPIETGPDLGVVFKDIARDALPLAAEGLVFWALASATPVPDEVIVAGGAIQHGRGLIGTISAYGRRFMQSEAGQQFLAGKAREGTEIAMDSLITLVDQQDYIGEAYVLLPASENWYTGRRVSVYTSDGTLEIQFSVVESGTAPADADLIEIERQQCNGEVASTLQSGVAAQVMVNKPLLSSVSADNATALKTVLPGDVVFPITAYCDGATSTLWWRVRDQSAGVVGWLPEFANTERILESQP